MASSDTKIAKKYARALVEATDLSKLEAMRNALMEMSELWQENAELREVLSNPAISQDAKEKVLVDCAKLIKSDDKHFANFLCLLASNNRLTAIDEVSTSFSKLVDEIKEILKIEITSAFELPDSEKSEISSNIGKEFGDMAEVNWKVDSTILGGLQLKTGDKLLDSSVRGALESFRQNLMS